MKRRRNQNVVEKTPAWWRKGEHVEKLFLRRKFDFRCQKSSYFMTFRRFCRVSTMLCDARMKGVQKLDFRKFVLSPKWSVVGAQAIINRRVVSSNPLDDSFLWLSPPNFVFLHIFSLSPPFFQSFPSGSVIRFRIENRTLVSVNSQNTTQCLCPEESTLTQERRNKRAPKAKRTPQARTQIWTKTKRNNKPHPHKRVERLKYQMDGDDATATAIVASATGASDF